VVQSPLLIDCGLWPLGFCFSDPFFLVELDGDLDQVWNGLDDRRVDLDDS